LLEAEILKCTEAPQTKYYYIFIKINGNKGKTK